MSDATGTDAAGEAGARALRWDPAGAAGGARAAGAPAHAASTQVGSSSRAKRTISVPQRHKANKRKLSDAGINAPGAHKLVEVQDTIDHDILESIFFASMQSAQALSDFEPEDSANASPEKTGNGMGMVD